VEAVTSDSSQVVILLGPAAPRSVSNILFCRSQWPRGLRRKVCGCSLAEIVGSNPAEGMDIVSVVCCQLGFSATC
jgi:hypothetical protein